jgi:hypothetical protein
MHNVVESLRQLTTGTEGRFVLQPLLAVVAGVLMGRRLEEKSVHLVPALVAATWLVALPHLCARDLTSRVDGWWHRGHPRWQKLPH